MSCLLQALAAATVAALLALPAYADRFSFMALGDTPYTLPRDDSAFQRLIARTNRLQPAFTVHLGDIKSGDTHCTDEVFTRAIELFSLFEQPLVYTPGDNEWTDCHRANSGRYDPIERLARVREMFFADPGHSLGRAPLNVISQSADPRYAKFVENARWERSGVVFATVHIPGSNNNKVNTDKECTDKSARTAAQCAADNAEHADRDKQNVAWLRQKIEPNVKQPQFIHTVHGLGYKFVG